MCPLQARRRGGVSDGAGVDGVIFFWDFETLDQADVGEDQTFVEIEPTRRIVLAGVSVREIVRRGTVGEGARWLLQDANSGLYWLDVDEGKLDAVVTSHAGPVVALEASPVDHFALTAGADGAVRCWDYVDGKVLFSSTVLCSVPKLLCSVPKVLCSVPKVLCSIPELLCSVPKVSCSVQKFLCSSSNV